MPNRLLFDTESDGFVKDATKVHCVALIDVDTGAKLDFKPDQIEAALDALDKAETLIGHNIQRHDIPLLTKIHGWSLKPDVIVRDTMICSRVKFPNLRDLDVETMKRLRTPFLDHEGKSMMGKHTIEAWGLRLGEPKGSFHGPWDTWTPTMHEYMLQDVITNLKLWHHLDIDNYSQDAVILEHRIARVCNAMEWAGVPFNVEAAGRLHAEIVGKREKLEHALVEQFGTWLAPKEANADKQAFTPKVNNAKRGYTKGEPVCKLKLVTFNPSSRAHIAKVLKDRGWVPQAFTNGGAPEINENVIEGVIKRYPELDGLGEYLMLDKRLSQLSDGEQAWLKVVDAEGLIHGVINPMGAVTSRSTHFLPNLSQVPSTKKPYGKQCRSLFYARYPKWTLVGADQDGLEGRGFAHFMKPLDGGAYETALLAGDPHWASAINLGFIDVGTHRDKHNQYHNIVREGSKRFYYAFIYGCWDLEAGNIILDACTDASKQGFPEAHLRQFGAVRAPDERLLRRVGKKARENFLSKTPGLERLKEKIEARVHKYGRLPGLDGRVIPIRSDHSALNFIIQNAGAIICKRWVCDVWDELNSKFKFGWDGDFVFILWIHDELEIACKREFAVEIGEIMVKHAKAAGEPYGFRIPLNSKYSIGDNWAEVH